MNYYVLGKILRETREQLDLKQSDAAKTCGVTPQTVSVWEKGTTKIDIENLAKLCDLYNISCAEAINKSLDLDDDLFEKYPNILPIHKQRVPLLGTIKAGKPIYADEDFECYVETDVKCDFCLRVDGDSMINARINSGDIAFIKKQDMVHNGEIAAVVIGENATLKKVFYYPEKHKLVLMPENPEFEPFVYIGAELDEVHILGKAVAFQSAIPQYRAIGNEKPAALKVARSKDHHGPGTLTAEQLERVKNAPETDLDI